MSGAIASVYAVFGSQEEAERIGRMMVEERLAACVNLLAPCRSIYHWQGAVEEAEEVPALFKTAADKAELLAARIAALHSYDVPAIAVWPIAHTALSYADWVRTETKG